SSSSSSSSSSNSSSGSSSNSSSGSSSNSSSGSSSNSSCCSRHSNSCGSVHLETTTLTNTQNSSFFHFKQIQQELQVTPINNFCCDFPEILDCILAILKLKKK
ncbi:hypothetical protein PV328_012117, partial [Microctonus aethiopoides]